MTWLEVRVLLTLGLLLWLPGACWMTWGGIGRGWPWASRGALALSIGGATYPLLFYLTPWMAWGPLTLGGLLAGLALLTLAGWVRARRGETRPHPAPFARVDLLDAATGGVLLLTLGVRAWVAHRYPFPGWTDSLHHTLLTSLTAATGQLPTTLEPYFPIPLDMYHRGLYALSAPVVWLAQAPAHTALLWTAQVMNALAALAVYLLLERRAGRVAGLVGVLVVGLLSFQPAFYVNWGRFTQLASQAILPAAWWVAMHSLRLWRDEGIHRRTWGWVLLAAWLSAGVFLLHYRVAVFYLPWLALGMLEVIGWRPTGTIIRRTLLAAAAIGLLALVLLSPVIGTAVRAYVAEQTSVATTALGDPVQAAAVREAYFVFPWATFWDLALRPWLFWLTVAALGVGLVRGIPLVWSSLIWALLLFSLGNAYLLRIPLLNVTNLGAVLILTYLPAAIILGTVAADLVRLLPGDWQSPVRRGLAAAAIVAALVWTPIRAGDVEPFRYFVTPADARALAWVRDNTPADARFAVNTLFWLPQMPHGTDAGYWIPYLTGRTMTAGVMLLDLADQSEIERVVADSHAAVAVAADPTQVGELSARGVTYLYAGALGNFGGPAFDVDKLAAQPGVEIVYQEGAVAVLKLPEPPGSRPASSLAQ